MTTIIEKVDDAPDGTPLFRLATRHRPHDIPFDGYTERYVDVPAGNGTVFRFLHVERTCRLCKAVRVNVIPKGGDGWEKLWRWPGETCLREDAPVCVGVTE